MEQGKSYHAQCRQATKDEPHEIEECVIVGRMDCCRQKQNDAVSEQCVTLVE